MNIRNIFKFLQINENLKGFRPGEHPDESTQTVVDNTTGIKYIVKRWQETGVVPSQIVRTPMTPSPKVYPWEKKGFDLSDIPTKHEYRYRSNVEDVRRELNATREKNIATQSSTQVKEDKKDVNKEDKKDVKQD